MLKIIDNFLPEEQFNQIKKILSGPCFPWYLQKSVTFIDKPKNNHWYFTHLFVDEGIKQSIHFDGIKNMFFSNEKIKSDAIYRLKANLYPREKEFIEHDWHSDYNFSHKGAIFYVNTNNGYTILENDKKIESIENRMLFFDASKLHKSTTCTDKNYRININFNFMSEE